ncbi:MAG: hypothetical protein LBU51_06070 [Bacteroidales bacterium]|jgi:hypothetical protein|nr:hypothetical protein [Bacteroidales bacterium]
MKKFLITLSVLFFCGILTAQSDLDAFRFSQTQWEGSARFMGAGGAFGAVGAEYSALAINPGTIGLYKRHEVTLTPLVLDVQKSNTQYNETNMQAAKTSYMISNAGIVLKANTREESKWNGVQFAFGFNRILDLNKRFAIDGFGNGSTITDNFIRNSSGLPSGLSEDNLGAWWTYLTDYDTASNSYSSPFTGKNVKQKELTTMKGGIDEMNFSLGANYDDKFYMGLTVGVPFIHYEEIRTYSELDENKEVDALAGLDIRDNLSVSGTGINLKLGFIYQPVDFFRVGIALHTPTYYGGITDKFQRTITSDYDIGDGAKYECPENFFKYKLYTPLRAIGSIAFMLQSRAFISVDYEYTDYSLSQLYSKDYSFATENEEIQAKYGSAHSVRIGGEVFVTKSFLLRAGYNFISNPYKDKNINNAPMHQGSIGFGVRTSGFFFDMAYVLRFAKENYWMYDPTLVNASQNSYRTSKIVATIGYKF